MKCAMNNRNKQKNLKNVFKNYTHRKMYINKVTQILIIYCTTKYNA